MSTSEVWDRFWKDKHGKVVLWQNPNIPLWTWIIATALTYLLPTGKPQDIAKIIAFGAIFAWSWLEISSGVNYFRRTLGLIVLILSILGQIKK